MLVNYQIAAIALIPFLVLLIVYIVILCRRKISDYYLRQCMWLLMTTICLRVGMSSIVAVIYKISYEKDDNEAEMRLIMLKLQVFEFSMPYYCFLMISVTLIVSAISFYLNLRNLLYPVLEAEDQLNESWHQKINIKVRYYFIQGSIFTMISVFCIFVVAQTEPNSTEMIFGDGERIFLYIFLGLLYIMTFLVVFTGFAVIYKLIIMHRSKPAIDNQQLID